ncbi:UTP--glucose-1-phosphate uridylyltransferase GalU [Halalkalibacter okhensis]|uniref:UTP--glucose-1-phosphate uridylyltransferase n=1 Tax=Halalkalibacter okhensis TaxID=333138 RepID=A0A0B0IKN1_9BACI|nr:UTP--glucose-1-phosphate uridylyltransferase GalU [Halalkalibacter okhensis]KHF41412.1 UTP--glucose-1-phosphate uridylyltransferase [Halalkalibacter okhensis]
MKKVRKAIIPAAGLGTRFLPATKAMPKEMLPIIDKPTIQYIVEEAIESGIEDIIIVTGQGKRAIEDHFDHNVSLENTLIQKQKFELLEKVQYSTNIVDIHYIRQKQPMGLGHAVWCARNFIGNEPFAVLLGDDIVQAKKPCLQQLIEQFEQVGSSVIGVQKVPYEETSRYGIIDPINNNGQMHEIIDLVEKPKQNPPSNLAIMGRYVLTPKIFEFLSRHEKGAGNEIQLTDAIKKLNQIQSVFAYDFEGTRYDVGEKLGFIKTTVEFALNNDELKEEFRRYLEMVLKRKILNV